jgi:hypothetical protein
LSLSRLKSQIGKSLDSRGVRRLEAGAPVKTVTKTVVFRLSKKVENRDFPKLAIFPLKAGMWTSDYSRYSILLQLLH